MVYPFMVKSNGIYYPAGTDVPDVKSDDKGPTVKSEAPVSLDDKNTVGENKVVSKPIKKGRAAKKKTEA